VLGLCPLVLAGGECGEITMCDFPAFMFLAWNMNTIYLMQALASPCCICVCKAQRTQSQLQCTFEQLLACTYKHMPTCDLKCFLGQEKRACLFLWIEGPPALGAHQHKGCFPLVKTHSEVNVLMFKVEILVTCFVMQCMMVRVHAGCLVPCSYAIANTVVCA
jgi:hypothetical protein